MTTKGKRRFYNNGILNKMFYDGDIIPDGFVLGHLPMSEETKRRKIEKYKNTCLEKYGVENVSQVQSVKEKKEKTCLIHYGVKNQNQSEDVREKTRKTNIKKYGTEYTFQAESVKEKIKQSNIEKYGKEFASQSDEIKNKVKQTNIERYGGNAPLCSEEIKDKVKQTCLERYGVENPNQCGEVREKIVKTNIERYGVENPSQSDDIKSKKVETSLRNYGVEHPLKSEHIKNKVMNTVRERYGVENLSQSEELKKKINETCQEKYGVSWPCQIDYVRNTSRGKNSLPNTEFEMLLTSYNIEYDREFSVEDREYDFKIENTLIEIDPFATHNTLWSPFKKNCGSVNRDYHYNKSRLAERYGYRVIHVFDWDDRVKVVNSLLEREVIYARKTEVREVSKDDCGKFLQKHHYQGSCRGQKVRLGLYNNNKLVSLMTFGRPRYNSKYTWELLRYCSSCNVVGGAEKLFKYFVDNYDGSIISYCDRSKFTGTVYERLGFTLLLEGKPMCHWYNPKNKKHYTDNLIRQRGVDQILGTSYGKGTDNTELMIREGYVSIYDCGQDSYVYNKKGD